MRKGAAGLSPSVKRTQEVLVPRNSQGSTGVVSDFVRYWHVLHFMMVNCCFLHIKETKIGFIQCKHLQINEISDIQICVGESWSMIVNNLKATGFFYISRLLRALVSTISRTGK